MKKYQFILDLQKFNNNCYKINLFLSNHNYYLRVFELRNKFRHLTMKEEKKPKHCKGNTELYC